MKVNTKTLITVGMSITMLAFSGVNAAKRKLVSKGITKTFKINKNGTLDIKNKRGNIAIRGTNRKDVEIIASKWVPTKDDFQHVNVEFETERNKVEVKTKIRKKGLQAEVTYQVTAPSTIGLDVETTGSFSITRMHGPIKLKARKIREPLRIRGESKVKITYAKNTVIVNGNAKKIELKQTALPEGSKIRLSTTEGDIEIWLPKIKGFNAIVDAKSKNGTVISDFKFDRTGKNFAKGSINNGGPKINLRTRDGNITIRSY